MRSGVSYYEQELKYIDAIIQAAERSQESESRARDEMVAQINSIGAELTEIDSVISKCTAKWMESQTCSKKILRELRKELNDHYAREKQLHADLDRHFNQARELMNRDLSGVPTLNDLYREKNEIYNQLRLGSSAQGIISGVATEYHI